MRNLVVAVCLLLGLSAVVHAADPAKTMITFEKGTTVLVNGQPVASGYQLRKGDKIKVVGGKAVLTVATAFGIRIRQLKPGATVEVASDLKTLNITGAEGFTGDLSQGVLASSLLPQVTSPKQEVTTTVSPSAP